jgi:CheY-like chemotaxis protein
MRAVARRHLVSLGYQVSEAESGPAALKLLRQRDGFDLLFTDVVMPAGMTGHQLANAARQLQPHLKVLFTTVLIDKYVTFLPPPSGERQNGEGTRGRDRAG